MVEMRSSGKNVLKTLEGRKRRFLMGTGAGVMEIETSCI
jgi:hypothetical protein